MNFCSCNKTLHYVELFLVLCFVLSVALNVKFFLDNRVLKELVSLEMALDKNETEQIIDDLHKIHKE